MRKIKSSPTPSPDMAVVAEALIDQIASKVATLVTEKIEDKVLLRPRWLNYEQAALYLNFLTEDGKPSVSALRQRKDDDQFPPQCYTTIGGRAVRWDVNELDKWLESRKTRRRQK